MSGEDVLRGLPRPAAGFGFAAAAAGADLAGHGPVFGDDLFGGGRVDGGAVGVADDVGHAAHEHRVESFGQVRGDHAAGFEVLGAAFDHLHVVDLGELGVVAAGVVRGADQG